MISTIEFVPIGEVDRNLLREIAARVGDIYGLSQRVAPEPMALPKSGYNPQRRQYLASALLEELRHRPTSDDALVLGVTDVDLYARDLNFVFGQAQLPGKAGVISLKRLRPEFWGRQPDRQLLVERAVKESVHELGHVLGLEHCGDPSCVMAFSNSLADTDRKSAEFCPACARKLERMLR